MLLAAEFADDRDAPRIRQEAAAIRDALRRLEREGLILVQEEGRALGRDGLTRDRLHGLVRRNVDVLHLLTSSRWSSGEAKVGLVHADGGSEFNTPEHIQEFLTAYALRSNSTSEILELVDAAEWIHDSALDDRPHNLKRGSFHGALAFLSGMLEDSSDLVKGLLERDLVLASECHREARSAGSAAPDLHQAIERSLGSGGEIHQHIGCLCLESLGDAWAVKLLERAAADETLAPRVQALVALGTSRSYSSFPLLQAAAKESDPDVARAAQDALARIKAG